MLDRTWVWLCDVLDVAEGQLREGKKFDTSVSNNNTIQYNTCTIHVLYMYYTCTCTMFHGGILAIIIVHV